jgi:hypothetical protein
MGPRKFAEELKAKLGADIKEITESKGVEAYWGG